MNRPIRKIVKELAESEKFQVEWDRQLVTAEKIASRHEEGLTTVLLADEVGMGKTYVALATIANHVFQTDENNSKVLLVVPPNNILARKWEQEIRTFNEKYLHETLVEDKAKSLRPMLVTDYWDLIQNLHNFQNQATPRVSEGMRQCFAFAVSKWNDRRREKGKKKREWVAYGDLKNYSLEYLDFCSWYSPRAIADFLDEKFSSNTSAMTKMVKDLNQGDLGKGNLNDLFKEFASKQDFFEANVFVIGMATLRRTRQDKEESTLLSTYIASCLLKNYREDTKKAALKKLRKHSFCYVPEGMAKCGNPHLRWFAALGAINLWGMYDPVWKVIESRGDRKHLVDLILKDAGLDGLFKELQAQVINLKLGESGIGLAVVDEVHNWKNGNNGAREFQERYAPRIPKKLIMSATPFQLHQDELGNVFRCAAGLGDSSIKIVDNLLLQNGLANACLEASDLFLLAWNAMGKEDHLQLVSGMEFCDDVSSAFDAMRRQADLSEPLARLLGGIDRYRAAIQTLQVELSKIVIRHTKNRDKRHFHAGREYTAKGMPDYAKIRRTLYAVQGYGASTNALVNFLAMRIDQLVRRDTHTNGYESNAHLLGGITSSNQAFIDSNGKLLANDKITSATKGYLRFFETALQKNPHPKVEATVERAFENFRMGNKTLIFCERLGTQKEILAALAILVNEKVFPNGGIEQARKDRETILKDHQAVELFWSRSYLSKLDPSTHDSLKQHLLEQSTDLIARVSLKIAELGGHANQRQVLKLLDLAMLQEIRYQQGAQLELVGSLFDANIDALKLYLRMKDDPELVSIDDDPLDNEEDLSNLSAGDLEQILEAPSIWLSLPIPQKCKISPKYSLPPTGFVSFSDRF